MAASVDQTASHRPTESTEQPTARPLPRRALLAVSGTAVLAAAAACSSGSTGSGTAAATPAASPSSPAPSPASSASASSSALSSAPSSAAGTVPSSTEPVPTADPAAPPAAPSAAEPAPAGTPVASVADVRSAGSVVVGENEDAYLLAYTGDTVVAHTAVCTHQRCTVGASGLCPCHQSRFDVATGAVINGPAQRPLAERGVTISGGQVYLT